MLLTYGAHHATLSRMRLPGRIIVDNRLSGKSAGWEYHALPVRILYASASDQRLGNWTCSMAHWT